MCNRSDCQLLVRRSSSYGSCQVSAQMVIMFMRGPITRLVMYFSSHFVIYCFVSCPSFLKFEFVKDKPGE